MSNVIIKIPHKIRKWDLQRLAQSSQLQDVHPGFARLAARDEALHLAQSLGGCFGRKVSYRTEAPRHVFLSESCLNTRLFEPIQQKLIRRRVDRFLDVFSPEGRIDLT